MRPGRVKPSDLTMTPAERATNLNGLRAEQVASLMQSITHHIGSAQLMMDRMYVNDGDKKRVNAILEEAHDLVQEAHDRFKQIPFDQPGPRRDPETDPKYDPSAGR